MEYLKDQKKITNIPNIEVEIAVDGIPDRFCLLEDRTFSFNSEAFTEYYHELLHKYKNIFGYEFGFDVGIKLGDLCRIILDGKKEYLYSITLKGPSMSAIAHFNGLDKSCDSYMNAMNAFIEELATDVSKKPCYTIRETPCTITFVTKSKLE